ncbi:MAG TPA: HNH endonuclease, partial [Anaeromyxobacteraceae bacterium]|nr:HNH endonuclease [Anaeromyxobacteraceae bacterium]
MTAIGEVAKVITPENRAVVLPRFFHCSSREAKQVVAEIAPSEAPPLREVVTAIRLDPSSPQRTVQAPELTIRELGAGGEGPAATQPPPAAPARKPDGVEPLTAELSRLHVTVSRRFLDKLDRARDALSHSRPGASTEAILEAGLDLLLARDAKRKGLVAKPRAAAAPRPRAGAKTRRDEIPASVKRAVWIRDQGRCQYPLESGEICGSTYRLEFDHIQPQALGG